MERKVLLRQQERSMTRFNLVNNALHVVPIAIQCHYQSKKSITQDRIDLTPVDIHTDTIAGSKV